VSALEEAEALVAELQALYDNTRVRADQIALSRAYWSAHRIAEQLRATVAA
jgi:hypothetical protein